MIIILGIHLPGNIKAFMKTKPELRLIKIVEDRKENVNYFGITPTRALFIYRDIRWPEGSIGASQKETFTNYNVLGMMPLRNGMIGVLDVSAVYIKPKRGRGLSKNNVLIEFTGVQSAGIPGRALIYLEKTKVAEFDVVPWKERTYRTEVNTI